MKYTLLILLTIFSAHSYSQKKLPVIKAKSATARIYEGDNPSMGWTISPEVKPDVFITNKLATPVTVTFKTDSDSISFTMKPGLQKDFIVVLNGKDSCYTRIESPAAKNFSTLKPEIHDTIPLLINEQNTIYVKAILNKTDTLNLNFDSGTTELSLTSDILKTKIKSALNLYNTPYELEIGKRAYATKVYDTQLTGHDTDGRFGWDLFDGMIVELNYDRNIMIVHSALPKGIKNNKDYTPLDIKYFSQLFLTKSQLSQSGSKTTDWFLFDTGYQRSIMLDNDLLKQNNFPIEKMEVIKKVMMHGAKGNKIPVITSNLEGLTIGKYKLKNVPAQILTTNKPLRDANIHILGNEVLKRFNTILDFQDNVVYLKPNSLFDTEYIEKK